MNQKLSGFASSIFPKLINPKIGPETEALPIDLRILDDPDEDRTPIPTIEKVDSAILALKQNIVPGLDGMPTELLKAGQTALTCCMHQLIQKIWTRKHFLEDWRKNVISPVYKKGYRFFAKTKEKFLYYLYR